MPTQPFTDAGQMIEPSVSEPTAICTKSAATAAPDPDDDPPALCLCIHGFAVRPPMADQPDVDFVDRIFAHSERLVAPITIAPASFKRVTSGESESTVASARASDPAVPGRPTASILSLIKIGRPASGRSLPALSYASASASASLRTARTERSS